jgi:twitching motility protein PilT
MHVNDLLKLAVEAGASDLHLKVGSYPMMRLRGDLVPANEASRLTHEDTVGMAAAVMSTQQRQKFKDSLEIDLAYSVPGLGRFRVNVFQQRGTIGLVLRVIPIGIKSIDDLGLPHVLKTIAAEERGLVLVTGTTGSGKSTTLAALVDHVNATRCTHVVTVEDPIEFLHRDNRSIINQREVSVDTRSFAHALRSALRQDPDVILVGEMRDHETIETALHASETGHLVFSTLHTLDASETINRIIAVFPPHQQKQIRMQLASVLKAVVSQRLLPKADGKGRAAAVEVMITTPFIRDCIVDKEKTHLIHSSIASGTSQYGMQTFDQAIFGLYEQKQVTYEEALRWASNKDEFKLKVQGISTTSDETRDQMARGTVSPQRPHASPQVTRFGRG